MRKQNEQNDIDVMLENKSLKTEFLIKGLNVDEIWNQPDDPHQENTELKFILFCIKKCKEGKSAEELFFEVGYAPPVKNRFTPYDDWAYFMIWANKMPSPGLLIDVIDLENPENIPDNEISEKCKKLVNQIQAAGTGIGLVDAPPIIIYKILYEWIIDDQPIVHPTSGWTMDGCSGYCPGCYQRPWCEVGLDLCSTEDDKIKSIHFRPELESYVSAWPGAYPAMRARQDQNDKEMDAIMKKIEQEENNDKY